MDAVLGLSVTPSAVRLVVVQGQDDVAIDGSEFDIEADGSWSALQTSEQATAAVLRAEAIAASCGHRLHSIGVTWSDAADAEASQLLKSLSDSGFDNIVPVRLSEATDALARGISEVAGYRTTAVCVIEPEQLIALVVQTDQGAVQTAVNHTIVTEGDLVGWLSAVFTKADWQPEALVIVGSAENLDGLLPVLEEALSVPVFTPAESQLALARGAALACAQNGDFGFSSAVRDVAVTDVTTDTGQPVAGRARGRRLAQVGPAAVLAAGVVTFVASASAALALQAAPERSVAQARPAADVSAQTPVAVGGTAPAPPQPAAPMPEAKPLSVPEVVQVPAPELEPVPDARLISQEAPTAEALLPQPDVAAFAPPLDAPQVPIGAAPAGLPAPALVPPPVPQEPTGLLQRVRDRLSGIGEDQQQPVAVPPPPAVP